MLPEQNVIYTKCYLCKMLPRQSVLKQNVTILRKCTIQNITYPDFFFINRFKEREVSISDLH